MTRTIRDKKLFCKFKQITREYDDNFENILSTWNCIQLVKSRLGEDSLNSSYRQNFSVKLRKLQTQHNRLVAAEKQLYRQEVTMRAELGMR